jgi:hypothetical protein
MWYLINVSLMYIVYNCVNIIKSMLNKNKQYFIIFKITALIFIQGTHFADLVFI